MVLNQREGGRRVRSVRAHGPLRDANGHLCGTLVHTSRGLIQLLRMLEVYRVVGITLMEFWREFQGLIARMLSLSVGLDSEVKLSAVADLLSGIASSCGWQYEVVRQSHSSFPVCLCVGSTL